MENATVQTVLLTIAEICERLQCKQRSAYNFVNDHAIAKTREGGETVFEIPLSAIEEQLQKPRRAAPIVASRPPQTQVLQLREELLQARERLLEVQTENSTLQSKWAALNNEMSVAHAALQRRKEEQEELDRLRKELRRIPSWLVHFFRMISGDKI